MAGNAFTLADLGLAAVVGVLALVPGALAFFAISSGLTALRAEERLGAGGFRLVAGTLGVLTAVTTALLAWVWGGATHLKPRCFARATPVYSTAMPAPLAVRGIRIEAAGAGAEPAPWAAALIGAGGFPWYEWQRPDGTLLRVAGDGQRATVVAGNAQAVLRVRRASAESGFWVRITADRFELRDEFTGSVLAAGEEMWIDAGPARFRCGIASGPLPVAGRDYPPGDAIARFLRRAVQPL